MNKPLLAKANPLRASESEDRKVDRSVSQLLLVLRHGAGRDLDGLQGRQIVAVSRQDAGRATAVVRGREGPPKRVCQNPRSRTQRYDTLTALSGGQGHSIKAPGICAGRAARVGWRRSTVFTVPASGGLNGSRSYVGDVVGQEGLRRGVPLVVLGEVGGAHSTVVS